jgi:hypothetical protein
MANSPAYFGFMQDSGLGSTPTYEQVVRQAQYNAAAIYRGDPVTSQTDGTVAISSPGTTQIAGIFQGAKYLSVSQQRVIWNQYWPGSDVASGQYPEMYIVNDPNARFLAQSDDTGLTLADVGANAQFAIGTPNAYTKQSGAYIDSVGPDTATLPFRVLSIVTTPALSFTNPEAGAYALAIVGFNNVDTKSLTGI